GEPAAAARELEQALALYRRLGNRLGQAETLNHTGALHLESGDPATARARFQSALRLARAVHSPLEEARALHGLARSAVLLQAVTAQGDTVHRSPGPTVHALATALVAMAIVMVDRYDDLVRSICHALGT